mmetsp:Transcript_22186/g.28712  ORF Transcript_22186/g.28712 Transcript_22186/m.28712 type:complete len:239 (-) Transcript_22186:210-926(-)
MIWCLATSLVLRIVVSQDEQYELGARKAFRSSEVDDLDDDYFSLLSKVKTTECFSGSDEYELTRIYCDQVCRQSEAGREQISKMSGRGKGSRDEKEFCNGPWYCSQNEICDMYHKVDADKPTSRKSCVIVRSCANHSQCFPNAEDADRMNIIFDNITEDQVEKSGFRALYGGMSFRTSCCANRPGYRPGIDSPCNPATPKARPAFSLLFFFTGGAFLVLLVLLSSSCPEILHISDDSL